MLGLFEVTRAVAQARDLAATLSGFAVQQGLTGYTNTRAADVGGVILALSNVLTLVLAIGFSVPRLRQRRRAFWIPIACAAIGLLVTVVVVAGLLAADPAFVARLQGVGPQN